MKKIGIITLTGNKNYGNKLQNYALEKVIGKYNYKVNTIWCNETYLTYRMKKIKNILFSSINQDAKRKKNFAKFNDTLFKICYINQNKLEKLKGKYSYYVIGSDQIWNPNIKYKYLGIKIFELGEKICSYAASLGVSKIDKDYEKIIKEKFTKKNIPNISVREDAGKKIIEEITKRKDVKVLIDPTMLLTTEEWDKISAKPNQINSIQEKKYILNYFLGEIPEIIRKEIETIAKENNCHIINILDKKDPFYTCGPSEFLYLEKNAFLICTDSFHSSVFAILYNTPFIIFERKQKGLENMNSRLESLLSKFKLEDRRYNGKKITKENLKHDYTEAYKILEKERKKSEEFLKKALEIE